MELCLLRSLFDSKFLTPGPPSDLPADHTVTKALLQGSGSCASLVALTLALTERFGSPFDAVILRDHVLLGSTSAPNRFYEVLASGEELNIVDPSGYRRVGPAGPIRTHGAEYLPYYVDNLAARLADVGRLREAEGAIRYALMLAPDAARLKYNLGSLLVIEQRHREAITWLTEAIVSGWRDADAYVNRGVAFWGTGHLDSAQSDFKTALALDPTHAEALANLSRIGVIMDADSRRR